MIVRGPFGGSEPARPEPIGRLDGRREIRPADGNWVMAVGTLACPGCDAPVAPAAPMSPADRLDCPFCDRQGAVRDFLSLDHPARPAVVEVRVVVR